VASSPSVGGGVGPLSSANRSGHPVACAIRAAVTPRRRLTLAGRVGPDAEGEREWLAASDYSLERWSASMVTNGVTEVRPESPVVHGGMNGPGLTNTCSHGYSPSICPG
jgi:hypothetical protein